MKKNHQKHAGITLIELSIVLVVMGFLAASIIIGKDLILSAQIRGQISQFHEMDAAVLAFRDKYNCLPGDCSNTVARGIAPRTGSQWDGNNDGKIQKEYYEYTDLTPGFKETDNFWTHLLHAGFVTGFQPRESGDRDFVIGEQSPKAVIPALRTLTFSPVMDEDWQGITGTPGLNLNFFDFKANGIDPNNNLQPGDFYALLLANSFTIGIDDESNLAIVRPDIAYMLDEKMDDGLPSSGKLRGKFYFMYAMPRGLTNVNGVDFAYGYADEPLMCVDTTVTPNQYRIGLTEPRSHCAIIYQGSWD